MSCTFPVANALMQHESGPILSHARTGGFPSVMCEVQLSLQGKFQTRDVSWLALYLPALPMQASTIQTNPKIPFASGLWTGNTKGRPSIIEKCCLAAQGFLRLPKLLSLEMRS